MDNHPPLGENSEIIRSHIGAENNAVDPMDSEEDNRMDTLLRAATIMDLVEDAGVPVASVPRVGAATTAVVTGTSSRSPRLSGSTRLSRGDLLSHIERSRDRQSAGIAEALGSVLSTIVNPPRTLRDISIDFEMVTRNLRAAVESDLEFWTEAKQSLMNEMRSLNSNNN